jgi:hypothetical protein
VLRLAARFSSFSGRILREIIRVRVAILGLRRPREHVKGQPNLRTRHWAEMGVQDRAHLGKHPVPHGLGVSRTEFGQNDPDNGTLLVPAPHIRLARRCGESHEEPPQGQVARVRAKGLARIEEQKGKGLPRPLGSLSLAGEQCGE